MAGFPGGSAVKNLAASAGDMDWIPGSGRSPGGGHGNPLQYSYLENPRTEEPDGLQSMGSQRAGHEWGHLASEHICVCTWFTLLYTWSKPNIAHQLHSSEKIIFKNGHTKWPTTHPMAGRCLQRVYVLLMSLSGDLGCRKGPPRMAPIRAVLNWPLCLWVTQAFVCLSFQDSYDLPRSSPLDWIFAGKSFPHCIEICVNAS